MKRLARILGFFLAICVVVGAVFALVGALVSYFHGDMSYTHAIAWALWLGGCLLIVLVGHWGVRPAWPGSRESSSAGASSSAATSRVLARCANETGAERPYEATCV